MKKKIFIFVSFLLILSNITIICEEKLSVIAVSEFASRDVEQKIIETIRKNIESAFVNSRHFIVVEKEKFTKIIEEQKMQGDDIYNEDTIKEMGNIIGADILVFGDISQLGNNLRIIIKGVDIELGVIKFSAEIAVKTGNNTEDDILNEIDNLIENKILQKISNIKTNLSESKYFEEQKIKLICNTPEVMIIYTLDGSMPSEINGEIYKDEIEIKYSTTIKAIAIKKGMAKSNIFEKTITIIDKESDLKFSELKKKEDYYNLKFSKLELPIKINFIIWTSLSLSSIVSGLVLVGVSHYYYDLFLKTNNEVKANKYKEIITNSYYSRLALFGIAGALGVPAIICMGIMIMIFVYKTDILNRKKELNIFTKKEIYELFRLNINMENESLNFAFSFLI